MQFTMPDWSSCMPGHRISNCPLAWCGDSVSVDRGYEFLLRKFANYLAQKYILEAVQLSFRSMQIAITYQSNKEVK